MLNWFQTCLFSYLNRLLDLSDQTVSSTQKVFYFLMRWIMLTRKKATIATIAQFRWIQIYNLAVILFVQANDCLLLICTYACFVYPTKRFKAFDIQSVHLPMNTTLQHYANQNKHHFPDVTLTPDGNSQFYASKIHFHVCAE